MPRAVVIPEDVNESPFVANAGNLKTLQTIVDGLIEPVYINEKDEDLIMYVNEEFLLRDDMNHNLRATRLQGNSPWYPTPYIRGNAVVVRYGPNGEQSGLTDADILFIGKVIGEPVFETVTH